MATEKGEKEAEMQAAFAAALTAQAGAQELVAGVGTLDVARGLARDAAAELAAGASDLTHAEDALLVAERVAGLSGVVAAADVVDVAQGAELLATSESAAALSTVVGLMSADDLERAVLFACRGECPKNRFAGTPDGQPGMNYLCAGYKAFFQRVGESMQIMAMLLSNGRPACDGMSIVAERKEVLSKADKKAAPGRLCPCGSGLTYAECHGWRRSGRERTGLGHAGCPRSAGSK